MLPGQSFVMRFCIVLLGMSFGIPPSLLQKPDGLVVLEPDNYKHKLFKLKLRDLTGINVNMERRLNKAGISTVEQFWNLSPKHVRKIWGSVGGERFWYKIHGYDVPNSTVELMICSVLMIRYQSMGYL
jgi:nucleotidyltransferase/DNA polymerase involved in DNA repair